MSIHILIGYVANMLRHMNEMGLSRINLDLNYSVQNEKYLVRELVIICRGQSLPQDFNPEAYLAECHRPYYRVNKLQNKIIITPLNYITFFDFQRETFHSLKLRLFDISTPIFLNDLQVNTNTQGIQWSFQDEYAYYLVNNVFDQDPQQLSDKRQHYFKELDYYLDKLVICNGINRPDILDVKVYGFSGLVVPKNSLLVKQDNLINKKECPRWLQINSKLSCTLLKRINSWQRGSIHPVLNRINRTILLNELTSLQLNSHQLLAVMDAPLFNTNHGTKLNMLNLLKSDKVNFFLDESKWGNRNSKELNYSVNCAEFFSNLSGNSCRHFIRLLNSPQHQTVIFLELVEKYFNTIAGCYKYKTVFSEEATKHLEHQRSVFQKNTKLSSRVTWVFHCKEIELIYEFSCNGLCKVSKKTKSLELAA